MHVHKTIDSAKSSGRRLTAVSILLAISVSTNLVESVLLTTNKEIILTPTLPDNLVLSPGGVVDPDYLEAVTRDVVYLFLNRTPETDRYFERAMERIMDASTYQTIKGQLVDDRKRRQDTRTSQAFFPSDFYVDAEKLYAEVRGNLEVSRGTEIVETHPKIYALRFVRRGSSVRLTSIVEIKPEASLGEKVKVTPHTEEQP
jgi:conjugal transfer pilus assembly protein TraE